MDAVLNLNATDFHSSYSDAIDIIELIFLNLL